MSGAVARAPARPAGVVPSRSPGGPWAAGPRPIRCGHGSRRPRRRPRPRRAGQRDCDAPAAQDRTGTSKPGRL